MSVLYSIRVACFRRAILYKCLKVVYGRGGRLLSKDLKMAFGRESRMLPKDGMREKRQTVALRWQEGEEAGSWKKMA